MGAMHLRDDSLEQFAAHGTTLPPADTSGHVDHDNARIWYASYGAGPAVVLLHGGLGHAGNFAHQVEDLRDAGYRVILIDSRGHGRSTRDDRPYSYVLMGQDTLAVLDHLGVDHAAFVGWSDGACIALILGDTQPERVDGVLFFACNMDPSGALPFVPTPVIDNIFGGHMRDYAALSATPHDFKAFADAVGLMQRTQPNYSAADLAGIHVPVTVLQSEGDEFIRPEHARYLADTIPGARLVMLPGVTHFAPLQRPEVFNAAILDFLATLPAQ